MKGDGRRSMSVLNRYITTDKDFYKKVLRIAVPVSLQQMITVGVNLMDTVMLSSMGDAQLSASSLAGSFINLFQIFCMGIGMGASVLTARYWGNEGNPLPAQGCHHHAAVCGCVCRGVHPGHRLYA